MKLTRIIPAIALAVLLTLTSASALAKDVTAFTSDDLNVNAAYAGVTPTDVHAVFGSPVSSETVDVPATGETQVLWHYNGLTLTFTSEALIAARWTDPALIGPRGLRVGDGEETVLSAFFQDQTQTDADVLYTAGWVKEQGMQLPPSGVISHDTDGTFTIRYLAPMEPYSEDVLADPMNFVYQSHASLTFVFDVDGTVSDIIWSVSSLAE
ncbi:MAG: hypothetical protein LLF96_05745 [Eubacteriales bacterium]|nr:hypothetical protein [Eubacteriales bacterium]